VTTFEIIIESILIIDYIVFFLLCSCKTDILNSIDCTENRTCFRSHKETVDEYACTDRADFHSNELTYQFNSYKLGTPPLIDIDDDETAFEYYCTRDNCNSDDTARNVNMLQLTLNEHLAFVSFDLVRR
jgi:hypothetical protein